MMMNEKIKAEGKTQNASNMALSERAERDRQWFCDNPLILKDTEQNDPVEEAFVDFSNKLNVLCRDAIERAADSALQPRHKIDELCLTQLTETFCPERISHVLAVSILFRYDAEQYTGISISNLDWAEKDPIKFANGSGEYIVRSLAGLLNEFTTLYRKDILHQDVPDNGNTPEASSRSDKNMGEDPEIQ